MRYLTFLCMFWYTFAPAQSFPADWEGTWEGKLRIFQANQETQSIHMTLQIEPVSDSVWTWVIQYGPEEAGRRDYQLLLKDKAAGHYAIDEKNGIVLDAFYQAGILYNRFSVSESLLTSRLQLREDSLIYEIISGSMVPIAETGGTSEEIPPVQSYGIPTMQRAILKRQ